MEDILEKGFIYLVLLTFPLDIVITYEKVATECYGEGNFHDMECNGTEKFMITSLQYGAKTFTRRENITCSSISIHQHKDACCSLDDDDCLFNIQDFHNRYKYLYEFSGDTFRSKSVRTEYHRVPDNCNVAMSFSNYVAVKYDCIKDDSLVHMCDAYSGTFLNVLYIFTNPKGIPRDRCECTIQSKSNDTMSMFAVDIRLQKDEEQYGNCTENNNNFTISDTDNDTTLYCLDGQAYGSLEGIFKTSHSTVNITLLQDTTNQSISRSQMVWIKINATSNSSFDVTCNRRLFTTTAPTTEISTSSPVNGSSPNGSSYSNQSNVSTTRNTTPTRTTKSTITTESTEQRRLRRVYFRNLEDLGLILMLGLVALLALIIVATGVYIRRRRRKMFRKLRQTKYPIAN